MFAGIWWYFKLCWKYDWKYIFVLLFGEIGKAVGVITAVFIPKFIIDALFVADNKELAIYWLTVLVLIMLGVGLVQAILDFALRSMTAKIFQLFTFDMNSKFMNVEYQKIETPEFLDLKQKAERFLYGNGQGFGAILRQAFSLIGYIVTLAGLIGIISQLSPWLILIVFGLTILSGVFYFGILGLVAKRNLEQAVVERRMNYFNNVMKDFHYGKEIRNNNLQSWLLSKCTNHLKVLSSFYRKMGLAFGASTFINSILLAGQTVLAYFYVIKQALAKLITVGEFSMYLAAITSFANTLKSFAETIGELKNYDAYYKALLEYNKIQSLLVEGGEDVSLSSDFNIEFENVSFKYGSSEKFALKNINIKFNSKERIAIIGENGAGKSTFVKLLMRLYEPTEGRILLNGVDIKDIDYAKYQECFSTVFQDFKLFSFSIKENITFDKKESNEDKLRLEKIIKSTGLDEAIAKLDKGVDTLVYRDFDNAGFTPSGGEGQKIAIARAAYKNAPIVILDEPTAALDPRAENKIYEQFDEFFNDKCSLYISHRMAVTKFSDRTLVFDNAELIQDGSHEELISQDGKYKELYHLQAKYYN